MHVTPLTFYLLLFQKNCAAEISANWQSKVALAVILSEVGGSATCSAMRISATCATRKIAADVRFDPQSTDCGIALAH
jgi:hypothetical protein